MSVINTPNVDILLDSKTTIQPLGVINILLSAIPSAMFRFFMFQKFY
jgi:hypothetical protein